MQLCAALALARNFLSDPLLGFGPYSSIVPKDFQGRLGNVLIACQWGAEIGFQAKTRFFKRNSDKADQPTLMQLKEREFWLSVASWALFVTKPSDLDAAFSDYGYDLPPLDVR